MVINSLFTLRNVYDTRTKEHRIAKGTYTRGEKVLYKELLLEKSEMFSAGLGYSWPKISVHSLNELYVFHTI